MNQIPDEVSIMDILSESNSCDDDIGNEIETTTTTATTTSSISLQTAIDAIRDDAALYWKQIPIKFQTNKELVLHVLRYSKTLPPKTDFERQFPQSLRFDRDYVLGFALRSDFPALYHERRLYVPEHLKNDKEIMLQYCKFIPRSLQDCSEELIDDYDIVLTAVSRSGCELQYASERLRNNESIVIAACKNWIGAIEHCTLQLRDKLTSDRTFLNDVMDSIQATRSKLRTKIPNTESSDGNSNSISAAVPQNDNSCLGRIFKYYAPASIREDRDLLFEAITKTDMALKYFPPFVLNSREFVLHAIQRRAGLYLELSIDFRSDREIAKAAVLADDVTQKILESAYRIQPEIFVSHDVALAFVTRGDIEFVKEILTGERPPIDLTNDNTDPNTAVSNNNQSPLPLISHTHLSDKAIMCAAVSRDASMFKHCGGLLQYDCDIIMASLRPSTAATILVKTTVQFRRQYPRIIVKAIQVSDRQGLRVIRQTIPDDLWTNNRDIAIAWIRRGCKITTQLLSSPFIAGTDEEIALEIAEHCWYEFGKVSIELRSNIEFLRRAIDKNGVVIRFAVLPDTPSISMPLLVRAISNHPHALNHSYYGMIPSQWHVLSHFRSSTGTMQNQLLQYINEKVASQKTFFMFLFGIATTPSPLIHPARRCSLSMLDRGSETSRGLKELIAQYVGVPFGQELRMLQTANDYIKNPPPVPTSLRARVITTGRNLNAGNETDNMNTTINNDVNITEDTEQEEEELLLDVLLDVNSENAGNVVGRMLPQELQQHLEQNRDELMEMVQHGRHRIPERVRQGLFLHRVINLRRNARAQAAAGNGGDAQPGNVERPPVRPRTARFLAGRGNNNNNNNNNNNVIGNNVFEEVFLLNNGENDEDDEFFDIVHNIDWNLENNE